MKNLYVLPGGGSPYNEKYVKVYDCIKEGGQLHNVKVHILDYVNCGHFPKFGNGLNLKDSYLNNENILKNAPNNSTLLCRSYGCYLVLYIMANHPNSLGSFSKIIFWGAVTNEKLAEFKKMGNAFNLSAKVKGLQISKEFFNGLNAVDLIKSINSTSFKQIKLVLGIGTLDSQSSVDFNYKLKNLFDIKLIPSKMKIIEYAEHEVIESNVSKEVMNEYYNLIFK